MRSYDPTNADDLVTVKELLAEGWMLEMLKQNPSYVYWGPNEDYMWKEGEGWDSQHIYDTWKDFGPWELDDLNEIANFYFCINRKREDCRICNATGLNPLSEEISRTFYDNDNDGERAWCKDITEDEVVALVEAGRLHDFDNPSAAKVNAVQSCGSVWQRHDGINRWILIKARCKRLGFWGNCEYCEGRGYNYTQDHATLGLVLWFLHPRKGCSRGIEIQSITQEELPLAVALIKEAAQRNADRFSRITAI